MDEFISSNLLGDLSLFLIQKYRQINNLLTVNPVFHTGLVIFDSSGVINLLQLFDSTL